MSTAITAVTVERVSPEEIGIAWAVDGPDTAVDVAIGSRPDAIDHEKSVRVEAGVATVVLPVAGRRRPYVSVAPANGGSALVGAERLVAFVGIENFRDLGGYRTADGGHTRWGVLFRADALHKLTAEDIEHYHELGMRTVYDLRGEKERAAHPNPFEAVVLPVVGQPTGQGNIREFAEVADGEKLLRNLYVGMLEHSAGLFARFLRGVLDADQLPAVFHCHAGKDRTGVAAALVLLGVGVARDDVLDDYELTRRYRASANQGDTMANMLELGMSPEAAAGVLSTPRWAMAEALDVLETTYGGIDTYLRRTVGLTDGEVARLRSTLVG
jgi:protein-tyrosine phosphatase